MRSRCFGLFLTLLLLVGLTAIPLQAAGADEPDISATHAILMDLESGQIYWSRKAEERVYPASITKLLTAWLVLEQGNLDQLVTVSDKAADTEGSTIYMEYEEVFSVTDLLYGLLLISGNDTAVALAERETGNESDFVAKMNAKAKEIGALNSHFANAHGLHDDAHYTTAKDYALIARAAWQQGKELASILQTREYRAPVRHRDDERVFINNNQLFDSLEGMLGGKNGYTDEAGLTFVGFACRDNLSLLSIVFNSENYWLDTTLLMDYGFDEVGNYSLIAPDSIVPFPIGNLAVKTVPFTRGVGPSATANRVLRLAETVIPQDALVTATLFQVGSEAAEVELQMQSAFLPSVPLWRQSLFWLSILCLFWILIWGVYRLLRARIEFLRQYRG